MLDKANLANIQKQFEEADSQRELLIKKSRDVLKLSKQLIYSIHREDLASAKSLSQDIKKSFGVLTAIAEKNPELKYSGSYKIAAQELVEALSYHSYVVSGKLPTDKELGVDIYSYLLGICDLTGELVRKAINDSIKGKFTSALKIKEAVEEIYGAMLQFDFSQSSSKARSRQRFFYYLGKIF
jgi:translin